MPNRKQHYGKWTQSLQVINYHMSPQTPHEHFFTGHELSMYIIL
uniref:Uncharacterized protein n=1 Tax=Rhizophora mucronata TaxID=61149 RepID=A0A2P2PW32_RHIMU